MAGALVLVAGVVLTSAAYLTVRRAAVEAARQRLLTLSDQLSASFRASVATLRTQVQGTAHLAPVISVLRSSTDASRSAGRIAIEYQGQQKEQVAAVEIRDQSGALVLSSGGRVSDSFPRPADADSSLVGRLILAGDSVFYPVVARVPGSQGGYLVHWRRVGSAARARGQIAGILGTDAELYVGNADGSLWTDLNRVAPGPPIAAPALNRVQAYTRPGDRGEVLASAAAVPGTPWLFTIEFPTRAILAPAGVFLKKMGMIAVLFVTLGLAAAWVLSRQIVLPLRQLTEAADAIAMGDTRRKVGLSRPDELGRLGESFNAMAGQVEEARHRLEQKVAERTQELNQTLERLQDTQESLVRREKLALVGHLASGVGHELRNPLGVMSNAVFYLDMVLESAPANVREYLGILRQQIALSGKIVNDLLDFSRTNPAQRQKTSVKNIATTQLDRLAPLEGIRVDLDLPDSLPQVHVDPIHAGQVVMNLLTNAVQAMGDQGGTLRLRARLNGGDVVILDITDTGPGVAPENLERIFEPLFTTKARGIGLGLAVSRSLAQANGGDLAVSSDPGRGATFSFAMPAAGDTA